MNVTKFLCISASLLLISCGNKTRDIPKNVDSEYLELVNQGEQLSAQGDKWNQTCDENPGTPDCNTANSDLQKLWGEYLIRTLKYKSQGEDCRSDMRNKIIGFNSHIALYNLRCSGGAEKTFDQIVECQNESSFIEQERVELKVEMDDCRESVPKLKE